jgi:CheY-like chemotaxis protein
MAFRILIADDSDVVRAAMGKLFLGIGGWDVVEACDGAEAVCKAVESKPDLIVLDLAMPQMDGIEASRVLQQRLPQVPVLLYTLHHSDQLQRDAQAVGVRRVISKSDTGELVTAIEQLVTSRAPAPKSAAVLPLRTGKQEEVAETSARQRAS